MTQPAETIPATRILIVEDEIPLAKDLAESVEKLGYEIMGRVSSTEQAVRIVQECQPDLVLMDVRPEDKVERTETGNRIRSFLDTPVIYLMGHREREVIDRGSPAMFHAYLTEPVSLRELHCAVEMAVYKHRTEKKMRASELKYRRILETIQEVYFEILPDGAILEVSPSVERVFGYRREDLIGSSLLSIITEPSQWNRFMDAIEPQGTLQDYEIVAESTDGSAIPCCVSAQVVYEENGAPGNILELCGPPPNKRKPRKRSK